MSEPEALAILSVPGSEVDKSFAVIRRDRLFLRRGRLILGRAGRAAKRPAPRLTQSVGKSLSR